MEEARAVLDRIARIEALQRAHVSDDDLLAELARLAEEAETWVTGEGDGAAREAVARLRAALARDMIAV